MLHIFINYKLGRYSLIYWLDLHVLSVRCATDRQRLDDWDTAHAVPVCSGSCMHELQPARLVHRLIVLHKQGPIRLRHACQVTVAAQRAAAASQPARWYRPTVYGLTDRPQVTAAKV